MSEARAVEIEKSMQPDNRAKGEASVLIISISTKMMVELFRAGSNKNLHVAQNFLRPASWVDQRLAKSVAQRKGFCHPFWRRQCPENRFCLEDLTSRPAELTIAGMLTPFSYSGLHASQLIARPPLAS